MEGNWKQVKGKVRKKWGKLTDDDVTAINGRRDDQARKEVDDWYSAQQLVITKFDLSPDARSRRGPGLLPLLTCLL